MRHVVRFAWLLSVALGGCAQTDTVPCEGDWPITENHQLWTILVTRFTDSDRGVPIPLGHVGRRSASAGCMSGRS